MTVQKQRRRWSDPFVEGSRQVRETCCWSARRLLGLMALASFVKEGGPTYCGTQGSTSSSEHFLIPQEAKRLLGKVRVCWRLASDAAGAVSTGAGPHVIADGASPHLRSQRWSEDKENSAELFASCRPHCRRRKSERSFWRIYKTHCRERKETPNSTRRNEHLTITGQPG